MEFDSTIWKKTVREQFREWTKKKHRSAFKKRVEVVSRYLRGEQVIDIGTGDGEMLSRLGEDFSLSLCVCVLILPLSRFFFLWD